MKTVLPEKFSYWNPCPRSNEKLSCFTSIPNSYFDIMHLLTGEEWKVLSYLLRMTYGFSTDGLRITIRQICNGVRFHDTIIAGVNLNRKTVQKAINLFERLGVLVLVESNDPNENRGNLYRIKPDEIDKEFLLNRIAEEMYSDEVRQFSEIVNSHVAETVPCAHSVGIPLSRSVGNLINIKTEREESIATQNRKNILLHDNKDDEIEYLPAEGTREYDAYERRAKREERIKSKHPEDKKQICAIVGGKMYSIDWFPRDIRGVVKKFCETWFIIPPQTRSQMAYWINGARELKEACGEYEFSVILELKKDHDAEVEQGKETMSVSSPKSLVNRARNKARIWREEDERKKKRESH